jgi:hypothetical protein
MNIAIFAVLGFIAFVGTVYVLYKLILWAKKRSKGAFLFAMFLPIIAVQPIPPPTYENIEEAKRTKKENEDDSSEPTNEDEETETEIIESKENRNNTV